MSRLRILLLAPDSNPEAVSIPFVTYSNAAALAELHDVTLLVRSTVEEPVRRAKAAFKSVEVVRMPVLERFYAWALRRIFKYNYDTQALTAFGYPYAVAFEWNAWRQIRKRIFAGEFDVVLRLMPMAPTLPSPFAFFLRKGPVPFVLGPLNGGLRSAPGFSQPDKRAEWVWTVRNLYRYLPFARSTYRHAAAIIIASYHMRAEFAAYRDKMFFVPENGIARSLCLPDSRIPEPGAKLKLIFIGGLVPQESLLHRSYARLLRSCERSWPTLPSLAMARSGSALKSLRNRLGLRRVFPSAVGSAMRRSSSDCDRLMWWYFQQFEREAGAWSLKPSRAAQSLWSWTTAGPGILLTQR